MIYELTLIKRQKLHGPGEHYGVKIGNHVIDFHDTYTVTNLDQFSKNNKFKVIEETKFLLPECELKKRLHDLKNYHYDFWTKNCEHWARLITEGKFESKQINFLAFMSAAATLLWIFNYRSR